MYSLVLVLDILAGRLLLSSCCRCWLGCLGWAGGAVASCSQLFLFLSSNFRPPPTTDALAGCGGALLAWLVPLLCSPAATSICLVASIFTALVGWVRSRV